MDDIPIAGSNRPLGGWFKHNYLLLILVFVFLASSTAAICYEHFYKEVVFSIDDGQEVVMTTWASTVGEALSEAEIRLYSRDEIYPSLEAPLQKEMKVTIKRAFPVHVAISDEHITYWTTKTSVRDIIQNLDIVLGIEDEVTPSLSSPVDQETTINIVRIEKEYMVEEVELAYSVIRRGNSNLDRGITRTVQRGKPGLREDTWEIVYRDGEELERQLTSSEVVEPKQDQIIEVGESSVLSRSGYTMTYNRVLTVEALAYCNCAQCTGTEGGSARTSTGRPAIPGSGSRSNPHIIAVDPGVIPL
ncbi:MAG: ubiquitin-like domain-containing protein, partial [Candidatus Contubernalis sp.]|nr:ubiquitin-like domain-containing protein [Candidatus Contubernalis sp.]